MFKANRISVCIVRLVSVITCAVVLAVPSHHCSMAKPPVYAAKRVRDDIPLSEDVPAGPPESVEYELSEFEAEGHQVTESVPAAYEYTPPARPLPLFYEVVTAAGPGASTDVAVNWQASMSQLGFSETSDGRLRASLVKRIRILSADNDVLSAQARTSTVYCESREATEGDLLVTVGDVNSKQEASRAVSFAIVDE